MADIVTSVSEDNVEILIETLSKYISNHTNAHIDVELAGEKLAGKFHLFRRAVILAGMRPIGTTGVWVRGNPDARSAVDLTDDPNIETLIEDWTPSLWNEYSSGVA